MENQENILDLYYNKHLKQKDIATMVGVSKQYVSKVIKSDSRCKAKYNSSIYHTDKNGNLKLNKGIKVGNDVPKTINMNIPIPTQKYKYRCYSM